MSKYNVKYHSSFKKDLKRIKKRNYDLKKLEKIINILVNDEPIPASYHDHELHGRYNDFRELHIEPDWLLVYTKDKDVLILTLTRTGTHSDFF